ncbi:hypothetical protein ACFLVN_04230 [Chloroflexota bacterium]
MVILVVLGISFVATFAIFSFVIPHLNRAKIVGKDMNKPGQPEVAEMGGLVIVAGFSIGIIAIIAAETFFSSLLTIDLTKILAVFSVILVMTLIGVVDDLIGIRQITKAFSPLVASLPLVAIKVGQTIMKVPLIGPVDFGIFYSLILVPIGVTVAANAFNMLAGFNGLETGMGIVAMGSLAIIAYSVGATTSFILLLAGLGALIATLRYNWYPAKVFIGDVGTLSIGTLIASAVIIGNFETAGIIIIIPYALDFLLKAKNRFPSKGWWGIYRDGKLYCPESGVAGLGQWLMKITGGISERNLTLCLIGIEAVFGTIAILLYTSG